MSRILNLQRQARELGRLRTGTFDDGRAQRSTTFIITSHSQDYIEAAAEEWGGIAEQWTPQGSSVQQWRVVTASTTLDAILPPGDPLKQAYELWSKGGCVRRCDGEREQQNDEPCVCRAQHGEDWHELRGQKGKAVCQITSRLNVILPNMPDIGVWRLETHSYYAAAELAAHVDLIRAAVSDQFAVPVRLRIEQRDRMVKGKPRHYSVPVVGLRGVVAGQVMAGSIPPAVETGHLESRNLPAIDRGPVGTVTNPARVEDPVEFMPPKPPPKHTPAQYEELAALCRNPEQVKRLWVDAQAEGVLTDDLKKAFTARAKTLGAEIESADTLWQKIVSGSKFDTLKELEHDFWTVTGTAPESASVTQLKEYLKGA
jgi:hypothetical protein